MSEIVSLAPTASGYPGALLANRKPATLYCAGNAKLLSRPGLAIVGSRAASEASLALAHELGRAAAAAGWVIVSGLALGIDGAGHRGALAAGGATTAVLGSGLKHLTPASHRSLARQIIDSDGLLVSDQQPDTPLRPYMLVRRNHTICALSRAVVVIESGADGGTMHAARFAAQLGRPLFCPRGSCGTGGELLLEGSLEQLRGSKAFAQGKLEVSTPLAQPFASSEQLLELVDELR